MFLQVSVCPQRGCVWLLPGGMPGFFGGHAWFFPGGACAVFSGGKGGHAWFFLGGMHGFFRGCVCFFPGGHAWFFPGGMHRTRRDTVNEWAVSILLECILVQQVVTLTLFGGVHTWRWDTLVLLSSLVFVTTCSQPCLPPVLGTHLCGVYDLLFTTLCVDA